MKNKETFESLYEKLTSSQTEEEVISNLKKILKNCPTSTYKSAIVSNPFFKSLLPEVLNSVCDDINAIRQALDSEIKEIDKELDKILGDSKFESQIEKLKELKRECISLIFEIDERKKDLISLI